MGRWEFESPHGGISEETKSGSYLPMVGFNFQNLINFYEVLNEFHKE